MRELAVIYWKNSFFILFTFYFKLTIITDHQPFRSIFVTISSIFSLYNDFVSPLLNFCTLQEQHIGII